MYFMRLQNKHKVVIGETISYGCIAIKCHGMRSVIIMHICDLSGTVCH